MASGESAQESAFRKRIVEKAESYVGRGEEGKDNRGTFITQINGGDRTVEKPRNSEDAPAWCALFATYVTEQVDPALFKRTGRASDLRDQGGKASSSRVTKEDLQPGNLLFLPRDDGKGLHVAFVKDVSGDKVTLIDGNRYSASFKDTIAVARNPSVNISGGAVVAKNTFALDDVLKHAVGVTDMVAQAKRQGVLLEKSMESVDLKGVKFNPDVKLAGLPDQVDTPPVQHARAPAEKKEGVHR